MQPISQNHPKATLNNEFNDDYEPVRCLTNDEPAPSMEKSLQGSLLPDSESHINKRRKIEQPSFQKQINRKLVGANLTTGNITTNGASL